MKLDSLIYAGNYSDHIHSNDERSNFEGEIFMPLFRSVPAIVIVLLSIQYYGCQMQSQGANLKDENKSDFSKRQPTRNDLDSRW